MQSRYYWVHPPGSTLFSLFALLHKTRHIVMNSIAAFSNGCFLTAFQPIFPLSALQQRDNGESTPVSFIHCLPSAMNWLPCQVELILFAGRRRYQARVVRIAESLCYIWYLPLLICRMRPPCESEAAAGSDEGHQREGLLKPVWKEKKSGRGRKNAWNSRGHEREQNGRICE